MNKNIAAWKDVNWVIIQKAISRIQHRIYTASLEGNTRKVRFLQFSLIHSKEAKFLAVKRVTEVNRGKRTPGVDAKIIVGAEEKYELAKGLKLDGKASKIRRIFIPKAGTIEKRPLGIPTIEDRAKQMLALTALEPEWEARFETNSYGFRPGRKCYDAIAQIYMQLRLGPKIILDADIHKCFEQISHEKLLKKLNTIPILEQQIMAWLKADILLTKAKNMRPDETMQSSEGTPQGGVISPFLSNVALHGMEKAVKEYYVEHLYEGDRSIATRDRLKQVQLIRYADDFIVTGSTIQIIQNLKVFLSEWLQEEIGLKLSETKTRIVDSRQGFEFLGFRMISINVGDRYKFQTLISRKSKDKFLEKTKAIITSYRACSTSDLIKKLNPIIIGWCNYFRYCQCTKDFKQVEYALFGQIRKWVFRRKSLGLNSKIKLKEKYFPSNETVMFQGKRHTGNWILSGKSKTRTGEERKDYLIYPSWVNSEEYVKIKGNSTPYDGNHIYWTQRLIKYGYYNSNVRFLLKKQSGKCTICQENFRSSDILEVDHIRAIAEGGKDTKNNLQVVHQLCHQKKSIAENKERESRKKTDLKVHKRIYKPKNKNLNRELGEVKVSRPDLKTGVPEVIPPLV